MKTKFLCIGLITAFSICLIACNKDDVSYPKNALHGPWNLIRYGGGASGAYVDYNKNEITWRFDTINRTVLINSSLDYFGPKTGTYPYEIRQTEDYQILFLSDTVQGLLYFKEDELQFGGFITASFIR